MKANPPAVFTVPTHKQAIPFAQWLARLSEHLPQGFIDGRARELAALYDDGCAVSLAATYCRVFLLAPKLETLDA